MIANVDCMGLEIRELENPDDLLDWLLGGDEPADQSHHDLVNGLRWALVYTTESIVWGKIQDGRWTLASSVFPDTLVSPTHDNFLRVRMFGPRLEVRIWRHEEQLIGRVLADQPSFQGPEWLEPCEQEFLLVGDTLERSSDRFSLVIGRSGSQQVLPVSVEPDTSGRLSRRPRLVVKHYFGSDPETGETKRVVSRLVDLIGG